MWLLDVRAKILWCNKNAESYDSEVNRFTYHYADAKWLSAVWKMIHEQKFLFGIEYKPFNHSKKLRMIHGSRTRSRIDAFTIHSPLKISIFWHILNSFVSINTFFSALWAPHVTLLHILTKEQPKDKNHTTIYHSTVTTETLLCSHRTISSFIAENQQWSNRSIHTCYIQRRLSSFYAKLFRSLPFMPLIYYHYYYIYLFLCLLLVFL